MKTIIILGVGFVIACVLAVRYGPWFKKTSTQVNNVVTNVEDDVKSVATKDASTTNAGS